MLIGSTATAVLPESTVHTTNPDGRTAVLWLIFKSPANGAVQRYRSLQQQDGGDERSLDDCCSSLAICEQQIEAVCGLCSYEE